MPSKYYYVKYDMYRFISYDILLLYPVQRAAYVCGAVKRRRIYMLVVHVDKRMYGISTCICKYMHLNTK